MNVEEYISILEKKESKRKAELMAGWSGPAPAYVPRHRRGKRDVIRLSRDRFVYYRRGTIDREVREDGTVWCLTHKEQLREYHDKRGHVQRKCRSCQNEYMRRWKARARERAGGETTAGRNEDSPVQT